MNNLSLSSSFILLTIPLSFPLSFLLYRRSPRITILIYLSLYLSFPLVFSLECILSLSLSSLHPFFFFFLPRGSNAYFFHSVNGLFLCFVVYSFSHSLRYTVLISLSISLHLSHSVTTSLLSTGNKRSGSSECEEALPTKRNRHG